MPCYDCRLRWNQYPLGVEASTNFCITRLDEEWSKCVKRWDGTVKEFVYFVARNWQEKWASVSEMNNVFMTELMNFSYVWENIKANILKAVNNILVQGKRQITSRFTCAWVQSLEGVTDNKRNKREWINNFNR